MFDLPENNIEPEKMASQKESRLPAINILGGSSQVSG